MKRKFDDLEYMIIINLLNHELEYLYDQNEILGDFETTESDIEIIETIKKKVQKMWDKERGDIND